jgi:hypothetical protein
MIPRVAVIIPTFNRKEYVQETIDSVLAQIYSDYEVIVIDDGSSDGTGEALQVRFGDRIRYVWQENQGESAARNHGIKLSRGTYIALLDSDDLWLPEKLGKQVAILDANPDVVLVFTASWRIDEKGQRLEDEPSFGNVHQNDPTLEALCLQNVMGNAGSTAMICRKQIERVGGFDQALQYGEDWDLWLRLRQQGKFAFIDEPLACIRQHGGSQWHTPQPETIDQRLADHKQMLENIFATWPGDVPYSLQERALARAYSMAAFLDYFIGRTALGQQRLSRAIELDPDYRSELQHLPMKLRNQFLHLNTGLITHRPVQTIIADAAQAFEYWPRELPLSDCLKSQLLKDICAHHLFESYKARDFPATRYCLANAILHDPSLLRNRGVWSIGLEVFLGSRVARWLRRTVK